jgi:hypothetical protein
MFVSPGKLPSCEAPATVRKDDQSTARARWLEREYVSRISSGKPAGQILSRTVPTSTSPLIPSPARMPHRVASRAPVPQIHAPYPPHATTGD